MTATDRPVLRAAEIEAWLATYLVEQMGVPEELVSPEAASRFFGIGSRPDGFALHSVVGIRDLWLGLLALAFALLRDYRALGLWLGLGSVVCLVDAAVVAGAAGKPAAIAFHLVSGVFCAIGAALCRRASRPPTPK